MGRRSSLSLSPVAAILLASGCRGETVSAVSEASWLAPAQTALAAAYASDGSLLALTAGFGRVRIVDVAGDTTVAELAGHDGGVAALAFVSGSRMLVTGGRDGAVRIWDSGWTASRLLWRHLGGVKAVAVEPEGRGLASSGVDGAVRFGTVGGAAPLWTRRLEQPGPLAFGVRGDVLAVGLGDGRLTLLDIERGDRVWEAEHRGAPVQAVTFAGERYLATGTQAPDGGVYLWDLASRSLEGRLGGHGDDVNALVATGPGDVLVSAGNDGRLRTWDLAGRRSVAVVRGHRRDAVALALSPDGGEVVSGGDDLRFVRWKLPSLDSVRVYRTETRAFNSVALSPDGRLLASGGEDGFIELREAASGRLLWRTRPHTDAVSAVAFAPAGGRWVSAGHDGDMHFRVGLDSAATRIRRAHKGPLYALDFSADGRSLLTAGEDGMVRIWAFPSGEAVDSVGPLSGGIHAAAFARDGVTVVSADQLGLRAWGSSGVRGRRERVLADRRVWAVRVANDNGDLAFAAHDGGVHYLRGPTWTRAWTRSVHFDRVRRLAFSPDGIHMLSASYDGTVRLLRRRSGRIVGTIRFTTNVNDVAFSADGASFVVAGDDGLAFFLTS